MGFLAEPLAWGDCALDNTVTVRCGGRAAAGPRFLVEVLGVGNCACMVFTRPFTPPPFPELLPFPRFEGPAVAPELVVASRSSLFPSFLFFPADE